MGDHCQKVVNVAMRFMTQKFENVRLIHWRDAWSGQSSANDRSVMEIDVDVDVARMRRGIRGWERGNRG